MQLPHPRNLPGYGVLSPHYLPQYCHDVLLHALVVDLIHLRGPGWQYSYEVPIEVGPAAFWPDPPASTVVGSRPAKRVPISPRSAFVVCRHPVANECGRLTLLWALAGDPLDNAHMVRFFRAQHDGSVVHNPLHASFPKRNSRIAETEPSSFDVTATQAISTSAPWNEPPEHNRTPLRRRSFSIANLGLSDELQGTCPIPVGPLVRIPLGGATHLHLGSRRRQILHWWRRQSPNVQWPLSRMGGPR